LKKSCVGALYLVNTEATQTTCKFKVAEAREKIFKLAENTCAIFSTGMIDTNQVWPIRNTINPCQIKSGNTVSINPGCYIWTMDHVISADKSETVENQMKTMDWAGELTELFVQVNTEAIHQVIHGLRTKYNGEFNTSELFKELDQTASTEAHWKIHLTSSHDPDRTGHLPHRHPNLEKMPQEPGTTGTSSISSTNANAHRQCWAYQQRHQIQLTDPNFHQHFIKKNPEERGRFQNNI
jgi:hypothetical protein